MLCNVIHDINIQLSLNYVRRGNILYPSIEGTSDPDLRLITCTSLINKLYVFRTRVFIHFITQTSRMSDHIDMPRMDLNAPELSETFALFQQQMWLNISVRNIKIDKQLENLFLALGPTGLQIYNSWSLDSSENNTDNVFIKFQDHLEPHANYWLFRLHLQQIRQRTEETVDNFVARIKQKEKKCGIRDNIEFEQRVIETISATVP